MELRPTRALALLLVGLDALRSFSVAGRLSDSFGAARITGATACTFLVSTVFGPPLAVKVAVGRDLSDDIWCADFTTSATASDLHCDFACPERPERPRRFGCPNLCSYKR
ncbi:hypothetical protein CDO31_20095 (plasmid) [Sinorhizobium meliloti]|nr:hypothetical protein CDO31_20095 [Sinorhizobium meliloti]